MKKDRVIIRASSLISTNPEPTRDNKDLQTLQTKWVPFFKDTSNLYVNDLALRYRRSATHASIINAKVNYTIGDEWIMYRNDLPIELTTELSKVLDEANNDMQTFKDVFRDICFNWITFGNVYIEVSKAKVKGTNKVVSNIYVHDSTKVRVDKNGKNAYISSFWRDTKNNTSSYQNPEPTAVPLWDKNKETTQTKFIVHIKRNVPEYDYYGLPDYIAVLKDCDIEYHCDTYNLARLENGFFPSAIVSMFGEPPEGLTDKEYIDKLKDKYSGSLNSGQPLFQLLDDKDQAAQVTEFSNGKEGEFKLLEESAKRGIIEGHRWFPALGGMETAGKLGNNQELINQWRIVMNTVIEPDYQQPMLRAFNLVLMLSGYDFTLGLTNNSPIGMEDRIDLKLVLSIDEQREILGYEPQIKDTNGNND